MEEELANFKKFLTGIGDMGNDGVYELDLTLSKLGVDGQHL